MTESLEQRVWRLEAERDIRELAHRYVDAADRKDWDRFRTVFHAGSTHRHADVYEGRSSDFVDLGKGMIDLLPETHHQLGNVTVHVTGDRARAQSYFTAHHTIPAEAPVAVFPRHTPGVEEEWWVGGRYFDELEYRDGRWGIVHRTAIHDWERWETADSRGFKRFLDYLPRPIDR